jgi:hypothetical protein
MWWLGWERQWFGLTADGGSGGIHCLGWLGNGSCIIVFGLGNYRAITKKWVALKLLNYKNRSEILINIRGKVEIYPCHFFHVHIIFVEIYVNGNFPMFF